MKPRRRLVLSGLAPAVVLAAILGILRGDSLDTSDSRTDGLNEQRRETAEGNRLLQSQPSPFVPNLGQWEHPAHFVHRSGSMTVFVEDRGWVLDLVAPRRKNHDELSRGRFGPSAPMQQSEPAPVHAVALRMTFEGDASIPKLEGEGVLPGVHNYFLDNDESRWRTHVPLYGSVLYRDLYPGIDMRLRKAHGATEYDLLLKPGAELTRVCVRIEGAEGLHVARDGSLVIETAPIGLLRRTRL